MSGNVFIMGVVCFEIASHQRKSTAQFTLLYRKMLLEEKLSKATLFYLLDKNRLKETGPNIVLFIYWMKSVILIK